MCWNARVSLQTFLFSTIPLILCYYLGLIKKNRYIIFQTFVTVQLIEYFLWTYLDTPWNSFFSKLGLFVILLMPFNSILLSTIPYKWYLLVCYLLFVGYILTFPIDFHTTIAKNKHLSWDWLRFPLPLILLWGLFFLIPCLNNFSIISLFTFVTFWVTLFTYYYTNTFGSMWCWIGNFISLYIYYLLARYFLYASK